jgi:hypothetical protein
MITGSKEGIYTKDELFNLKIVDVPGGGGIGPNSFTISVSDVGDLTPSTPGYSITLNPSGAIANGTDSLGQIGVLKVFDQIGTNGTIFGWSAGGGAPFGGTTTMAGGFWNGTIHVVLNGVGFNAARIYISYDCQDPRNPAEFPNFLTDPPKPPQITVTEDWPGLTPPDKEKLNVEFQYDNLDSENPDGFAILRSDLADNPTNDPALADIIASVPFVALTDTYNLEDVVLTGGVYTYWIQAYRMSDTSVSPLSESITITIGGPSPSISIVGSGGMALGGTAIVIFMGDPSGIYTITEGKTHDTLYQRTTVDHIDMPIPNPYGITGYLRPK